MISVNETMNCKCDQCHFTYGESDDMKELYISGIRLNFCGECFKMLKDILVDELSQ